MEKGTKLHRNRFHLTPGDEMPSNAGESAQTLQTLMQLKCSTGLCAHSIRSCQEHLLISTYWRIFFTEFRHYEIGVGVLRK